ERERHEGYRLLYVAASRARDHLIISGSVMRSEPRGWLELLLGPVLEGGSPPGTFVTRSSERPAKRRPPPRDSRTARNPLPPAWIDPRFEHHPFEPLLSPSRLVGLLEARAAAAAAAEGSSAGLTAAPRAATEETVEATEPMTAGESALGAV